MDLQTIKLNTERNCIEGHFSEFLLLRKNYQVYYATTKRILNEVRIMLGKLTLPTANDIKRYNDLEDELSILSGKIDLMNEIEYGLKNEKEKTNEQ